ncbi:hypothetical protein ASPTUDRAFT_37588 [Aspergillus tubingensis CBS 134.48]|uniref:Uncharacterized protein n=1 Tax=Aspergillus tubingensis (strain CBS 134.48) TaxID=767770 RepID=A0A1L9NNJ4_ASPTC|nr:hypothetical protein ASPTUDRAFT_37588 [Aspergillus tubingensis CBS 134.48]
MDLQETRSPNSGQWVPLINHQTHATIHASGRSSKCQLIVGQLFIQGSSGNFEKMHEARTERTFTDARKGERIPTQQVSV